MLSENIILKKAVEALRERLPESWSVALIDGARAGPERVDGELRLVAPDGRVGLLITEAWRHMDPRRAVALIAQARGGTKVQPFIVVAPWMSSATRRLLVEGGLSFLDLTGNIRILLSEPGLFIASSGAERDPWPEVSGVTLRGAKAARVVRTLATARLPQGVRALAEQAGTTPGYVSKLLGFLAEQAAVQRSAGGQVTDVDLRRLIERWAEQAPLDARAQVTSWIEPRGQTALLAKLRRQDQRYAITGSLVASRRAPIAPPRVVSVYVDDPDAFARTMDLRQTEAGANLLLLTSHDDVVFADTWEEEGLRFAALPQVAADLLSGPGRGPAEAEALLTWMIDNPEAWRG